MSSLAVVRFSCYSYSYKLRKRGVMSKRFLAVLAVIIIAFAGISYTTKSKTNTSDSGGTNKDQTTSHISGLGKKNVTLIEYGDFQCPACGQYYPIVKAVAEKYKDDIFFQFRNYPLITIHPNALAASRATEAAGKQNKYWEMHDLLYEQQKSWSSASNAKTFFEESAKQLGLDLAKFNIDYASDETNNFINADIKAGHAISADSTPTFVLDGKKIEENPRDLASFNKLIEDAIAAKNK